MHELHPLVFLPPDREDMMMNAANSSILGPAAQFSAQQRLWLAKPHAENLSESCASTSSGSSLRDHAGSASSLPNDVVSMIFQNLNDASSRQHQQHANMPPVNYYDSSQTTADEFSVLLQSLAQYCCVNAPPQTSAEAEERSASASLTKRADALESEIRSLRADILKISKVLESFFRLFAGSTLFDTTRRPPPLAPPDINPLTPPTSMVAKSSPRTVWPPLRTLESLPEEENPHPSPDRLFNPLPRRLSDMGAHWGDAVSETTYRKSNSLAVPSRPRASSANADIAHDDSSAKCLSSIHPPQSDIVVEQNNDTPSTVFWEEKHPQTSPRLKDAHSMSTAATTTASSPVFDPSALMRSTARGGPPSLLPRHGSASFSSSGGGVGGEGTSSPPASPPKVSEGIGGASSRSVKFHIEWRVGHAKWLPVKLMREMNCLISPSFTTHSPLGEIKMMIVLPQREAARLSTFGANAKDSLSHLVSATARGEWKDVRIGIFVSSSSSCVVEYNFGCDKIHQLHRLHNFAATRWDGVEDFSSLGDIVDEKGDVMVMTVDILDFSLPSSKALGTDRQRTWTLQGEGIIPHSLPSFGSSPQLNSECTSTENQRWPGSKGSPFTFPRGSPLMYPVFEPMESDQNLQTDMSGGPPPRFLQQRIAITPPVSSYSPISGTPKCTPQDFIPAPSRKETLARNLLTPLSPSTTDLSSAKQTSSVGSSSLGQIVLATGSTLEDTLSVCSSLSVPLHEQPVIVSQLIRDGCRATGVNDRYRLFSFAIGLCAELPSLQQRSGSMPPPFAPRSIFSGLRIFVDDELDNLLSVNPHVTRYIQREFLSILREVRQFPLSSSELRWLESVVHSRSRAESLSC